MGAIDFSRDSFEILFNIQGTPGKVLSIENVFFRFFNFPFLNNIVYTDCALKLRFKNVSSAPHQ